MYKYYSKIRCSHELRVRDIIAAALLEELRAHDPREAGYEYYSEGNADVHRAFVKDTYHNKSEQNARERSEAVIEPHQYLIHHSAVISGECSDKSADHRARHYREQGDQEGRSRTLYYSAENVTAEVVGTEDMPYGRALKNGPVIHLIYVVRKPEN